MQRLSQFRGRRQFATEITPTLVYAAGWWLSQNPDSPSTRAESYCLVNRSAPSQRVALVETLPLDEQALGSSRLGGELLPESRAVLAESRRDDCQKRQAFGLQSIPEPPYSRLRAVADMLVRVVLLWTLVYSQHRGRLRLRVDLVCSLAALSWTALSAGNSYRRFHSRSCICIAAMWSFGLRRFALMSSFVLMVASQERLQRHYAEANSTKCASDTAMVADFY